MKNGKNDDNVLFYPKLNDIHEFIIERFNEIENMGDLVKFHSINKYLIMSHSPKHLRILGNIVANHNRIKIDEVLEKYQKKLREALDSKPTTKSHYNTLQHILGHFLPDLSTSEKRYFLLILQNFRDEKSPLSEILEILKESTSKYDKKYLARQTYFLLFTRMM